MATYIPRIAPSQLAPLLVDGHYRYFADDALIAAANAALGLRRPLLLTGPAGSGKTRFAHAVALWFLRHWVGAPTYAPTPASLDSASRPTQAGASDPASAPRPLASLPTCELLAHCIVRSDSRARDLLYRYDALARFGDAQLDDQARRWARNPRNYISLEPLGRALTAGRFSVVLVDEIDKAPRDLPNDLLDVLDGRRFEIPELRLEDSDVVRAYEGEALEPAQESLHRWMLNPGQEGVNLHETWPFIVITSNTERQLPAPFVRRCVCYHLRPFDRIRLRNIVQDRFSDLETPGRPLGQAVVELHQHLQTRHLEKPPGTAELVDALEVLRLESLARGPVAAWEVLCKPLLTLAYQVAPDEEKPVFGQGIVEGGVSALKDRSQDRSLWSALPFLGCLVKLEADIRKLTG